MREKRREKPIKNIITTLCLPAKLLLDAFYEQSGDIGQVNIFAINCTQVPYKVGRIHCKIGDLPWMKADLGTLFRNKGAAHALGRQIDGGGQVTGFQQNIRFQLVLI